MPDYVVCTRAINGGSFSSEPGPTRFLKVPDKQNPGPSREINSTTFIADRRTTTPTSSSNPRQIHRNRHQATSNSAQSQSCPEFMLQHAKPPATPNHDTSRRLKLELRPFLQAAARSAKPRIVAHLPSTNLLAPSNVKRVGVAPRAVRVGLPENAPAKAVGVDCGARFLKTHPTTNPVVDPISHGWYFNDPVFLNGFTFTLTGDMNRKCHPDTKNRPNPQPRGEIKTNFISNKSCRAFQLNRAE